MRRIILASLTTSLLGFAAAVGASPPHPYPSAQIDVMTQNQYLGAALEPVVAAGAADPFDPVAFNAATLNALAMVAANLPEQRYEALAREIRNRRPHVVGLQEVFEFSCTAPGPDDPNGFVGNGCLYAPIAGAFNDHLAGTLDALDGTYVSKAIVRNLNVTLPIVTPVGGAYVTVLDRDVILVRQDFAGAATVAPLSGFCSHPSVDGCNYDVVGTTSIGGQELRIERGFVGIDLTVANKKYRIVNTHLEQREPDTSNPYSRIVQSAQAYQLILTTTNVTPRSRKLIVIGDINSDPRDPVLPVPDYLQPFLKTDVIVPPYMQFIGATFTDTWTLRPGAEQGQGAPLIGFSCCQLENLRNFKSVLYERIDMIFSLQKPCKVIDARLIGTTQASKTRPPVRLWAADHAAVAAALLY